MGNGTHLTRSEAIAHVARCDLEVLPADERGATLATMHCEAWDTDPGWVALPEDLREELASGRLKADASLPRYDGPIIIYISHGYRGATNDYLAQRMSQLGVASVSITGEAPPMKACPCCGRDTLDDRGQFDICVVCWWEDAGQDNESADEAFGGPNENISLSRARANFLIHGIYCPAREDLLPHQEPASKFARSRRFVLVDDNFAVEEPAARWRSSPLR